MFLTVLLSIVSTAIIAAVVSLILYLVSFKSDHKQENQLLSDQKQENQLFLANVEEEKPVLNQELLTQFKAEEQLLSNNEVEKPSINEKILEQTLIEDEFESEIQEKPVFNEVISPQSRDEELFENLSEDKVDNISNNNSYFENIEHKEQIIDNKSEININEDENSLTDLLHIDDTHNLTHFNKSRPKKPKSRPSIKIAFSKDSNENCLKMTENIDTKEVTNIFENTISSIDSDDFKGIYNKSLVIEESVFHKEETISVEKVVTKYESSFSDETFEQISTGDYKKFDEFSDYFSLETKRQEFIKKCELNKNKSSIDDLDGDEKQEDNQLLQQTNDEIVDELFANFIDETKEDFSETENSITQLESLEVKSDDSIELSVSNYEMLSQKEKANTFKLSLSKVLSSDKNLSPSKSPLSATIESATKPLLSSPSLSRKSISSFPSEVNEDQEEESSQEEVSKRVKKLSLPVFGLSQNSLINEMREKQFRMSLKSRNSNSEESCDATSEKPKEISEL
jgi:hypothetical protein